MSELKVNLQLSITRLKLLQQKKTELSKRSRLEIAEHLKNSKTNRARIRVESILREDYLIESMEIVELYCDLVISRMGVLQHSKTVPPALEEAIASIIWATNYLSPEVPELTKINNIMTKRYGKEFVRVCAENSVKNVNPMLVKNMTYKVPDRRVVESYLVEIARVANINYEPNPEVVFPAQLHNQIGFDIFQDSGPPTVPDLPGYDEFTPIVGIPGPTESGGIPSLFSPAGDPPRNVDKVTPNNTFANDSNLDFDKMRPDNTFANDSNVDLDTVKPEDVPANDPNEDFDLDDLSKRFEALKKFK